MARILVVDDDLDHLDLMELWLTDEQHSIDAVAKGVKAWEHLQNNEYDLVVLDWDLPDINGIDILKKFRTAGGTTPVIMLTGRNSVDDKAEGLDSGAADYLTKPFHMKELAARVRAALRKTEAPAPKALPTSNQELLKKADLIGTSLAARYEFIDVLGEGGIGIVYKARHPQLDKVVAIKMILKNEMSEESVARFEREARAISRLDHANIAIVHDFGTTERRQPYMVMEFIEGKSFDQLVRDQGPFSLSQGLDIFIQVCDGMSHAHGMGIVHRDIKSSNIMLKEVVGSSAVAKILDFGCAKLRDIGAEKAPALTQAGVVVGSPYYMSPEQIQWQQPDERSDVYSLGCVIYEMFTACFPHVGEDAAEIMLKHINEDIPPLADVRPDLSFPDQLELVVARALEKERDKRYQSMRELKAELEQVKLRMQVTDGGTAGSSEDGPWWRFLGKLGKK